MNLTFAVCRKRLVSIVESFRKVSSFAGVLSALNIPQIYKCGRRHTFFESPKKKTKKH